MNPPPAPDRPNIKAPEFLDDMLADNTVPIAGGSFGTIFVKEKNVCISTLHTFTSTLKFSQAIT
jgi:hypothetical protein